VLLEVVALLAKLAKPDCPNAGPEAAPEAPAEPPPEPHGELLAPRAEDCPNPGVLGLPKAGAAGDAVLPNELDPNVAPWD
jgi:hypothetical protein